MDRPLVVHHHNTRLYEQHAEIFLELNTCPVFFLVFANDRDDRVRYLRNLPEEARRLREQLSAAEANGLCEVVERNNATADDVFKVFQSEEYRNRIAVFHYGGHANGHSLLFESTEGAAAAAHAEGLARFMGQQRGLRLVFLNGCSTQEQVSDLLSAGIPAVIATSRAIDDKIATDFSECFYRGVCGGADLQTAYREAESIAQTKQGTNTRALYTGKKKERDEESIEELTMDRCPWGLHIRSGAHGAASWNLPEAANNPLFGLPELPFQHLPPRPFRNLQWFEKKHADIFFGRGHEIRELYSLTTNPGTAPIILYYGQSGVGKSSLLDAGLLPRLQAECRVTYLRRTQQQGLSSALQACLSEQQAGKDENASFPSNVIIMDQLEEVFTRPIESMPAELDDFLQAISRDIVYASNPDTKVILSFRKEWLAEVEDAMGRNELPFNKLFLDRLDRRGIEQAVRGPTQTERLQAQYHLTVDEDLPTIIADDLLEDPSTPVAPTLQVLLSRMWDEAVSRDGDAPRFDVALYQELRRHGILLDDFLRAQIDDIKITQPEAVESGLLLDFLLQYTTPMGTAQACSHSRIKELYQNQLDVVDDLHVKCIDRFLLTNVPTKEKGLHFSRLSHDTLAPVVREMASQSESRGQRARRCLESRFRDWKATDGELLLDETALKLIDAGRDGMASMTEDESQFVEQSRSVLQANKPVPLTREILPAELEVVRFEEDQMLEVKTADVGHQPLTYIGSNAFYVIFLSFVIVLLALGMLGQLVIGVDNALRLDAMRTMTDGWQSSFSRFGFFAGIFIALTGLNVIAWFGFFMRIRYRFDLSGNQAHSVTRLGKISAPVDSLRYGVEEDTTDSEVITVDEIVLVRRPLSDGQIVDDSVRRFYLSLCHAVGRSADTAFRGPANNLYPPMQLLALLIGIAAFSYLIAPLAVLTGVYCLIRLKTGVDSKGHPAAWFCTVNGAVMSLKFITGFGGPNLMPVWLLAALAIVMIAWLREIIRSYTESPLREDRSLLFRYVVNPVREMLERKGASP